MENQFDKAFISFRIGPAQWLPDRRFNELLCLFQEYAGVTDEITFFTGDTHPPLPLEVIGARAEVLLMRMSQARQAGYRAGINILATIGHHNENLDNSLSGNYTNMTDINGSVCLGSYCPNDERVRDYVRKLYRIVTSAEPDYIWIDDDVRLYGHMPITCGCFCDNCLSIFGEETGKWHTREELKAAFDGGTVDAKLDARKAWIQHNRVTMNRLLELIENTVHSSCASLPIGFMTGDRFFEGYDFNKWAKTLSGDVKAEVMWRPGGGYYADQPMNELVAKSHAIGRQVSMLPKGVTSIQSEIENFPYQILKKSARATAVEAASHIAAGCTGAAFNVFSMHDGPLDEYKPLVAKLGQTRSFYDLMVSHLGRETPVGIHTGWGKDIFASNSIKEGSWFDGDIWGIADSHSSEIFEIGLPAAYSTEGALVTVLIDECLLAMPDECIPELLSSGVYMDVSALARLNEMGYGELTGFTVDSFLAKDCIEEFTDHRLNAGYAGRHRDVRQSFNKYTAGVLNPLNSRAEALSRIVDYDYKESAPCCMGIFENRLGGRICVSGYYPWTFLQNLSKASQIKAVMRWLSKDGLPAYIESLHKIHIWARNTGPNKLAVAVMNSSLDETGDLSLILRTNNSEISVFDMRCKQTAITSCENDEGYRTFILPSISPYEMNLVIAE